MVSLECFVIISTLTAITRASSKATNNSVITITNTINITDTLSVPIRLEINDEFNIAIKQSNVDTRQSVSATTSAPTNYCCLLIDPPSCNSTHCVIRRRKACWNICTSEIMIKEAPGFPKEKFPRQYIPDRWQTEVFQENVTIALEVPQNIVQQYDRSMYYYPKPQGYWWCPGPYCNYNIRYRK